MGKKIQIAIIVVLTALAYSNIFQNEFVSDDRGFILKWAADKEISDIPSVIAGDGPPFRKEATYRPVRDTLYVIYGQIFGKNSFGWHLHGLAVHVGVTILVYLIVEMITRMSANVKRMHANSQSPAVLDKSAGLERIVWMPFIAALFFGLHPVHTEAITFMTSSMDMVGPLFFFGAFWTYLKSRGIGENQGESGVRKWRITALTLATLAFFSYEMTMVLPILIVLYEWTLDKNFQFPISNFQLLKKRILIYLPYFAAVLAYVLIRVFLIGRQPLGVNYWIDDTSYNWSRVMEPEILIKYLELLIVPLNLSFNHMIRPGFDTFLAWVNDPAIFENYSLWPVVGAALVVSAIIVFSVRSRKAFPILTFSILWFFVAQLLFANIFSQPAVMADRYIYIASFGFILLVAYILSLMPRIMATALVVFLVIFWGTLTYLRNLDWKEEIGLWQSVIRVYPKSALAYNNIAKKHIDNEEYEQAIPFYQNAIELRPRYFYAISDLATSLRKIGKLDLALQEYKKSLAINPNYLRSYIGLAQVYRQQKRYDLAISTLEEALKIKKENTPLSDEGFENLQSDIYNDIGVGYQEQNKVNPALDAYVAALKLDPESSLALNNLRKLILDNPSTWKTVTGHNGSFAYPPIWELVDQGNKYTLISEDRQAIVEIEFEKKGESTTQFLKKQSDNYGEVVSEEYIRLSNFDQAYVKVWKDVDIHKVQFYLFKNDAVVKILAYPSESSLKPVVDGIIGSIKISD